MPVPTIYYIRHGETAWNARRPFPGIAGYSAQRSRPQPGGRRRRNSGRPVGARWAQRRRRWPFVASPLGRARIDDGIGARRAEIAAGRLRVDDRLREIGYGHWEGSDAGARCKLHDAATFAAPRRRQMGRRRRRPARAMPASRLRMRDWFDSARRRHGRGRPWRHHAGADGGAGRRDAATGRRHCRSSRAWSMCSATAG